jgi:UDP-N-acetylglucosamine/UDP-N-acetylgalactosamine diphosphorylase
VTPLRRDLARVGQEHLLEGVDALSAERRERFLARLAEIDWDELAHPAEPPPVEDVAPPRVVTLAERAERHAELLAAGEDAYGAGRVAVLVVAGGQGTRLGLAPGQLRLFTQGTVPSVDRDGRALLAAPGVLLENPDGHGGVFQALVRSGELERLRREGVTTIVYVQVDNVLAPVDDPELVGLAALERADVVTKVLPKAHPDEKVGHLVRVGERDRIVEYTELTPAETRATTPDGELLYRWGSPAMHAWSVEFLARLADRGYRPPLHRSAKPLQAWLDGEVREVEGWKHERFVFDLVPEAEVSVGMEIDRDAEFAPVKNADGADSPATAVELAHRQYVSWLGDAGVAVDLDPDERVEISPLLGATRRQFLERWDGRFDRLDTGAYLE